MEDIKLFLKGFIIGIGKIIPGVSGALFAMMFGVYEKSLNIISNLKTELKKNKKYIFILVVSISLAIIFGSIIIKKCLDNFYLQTMLLFIGMMCAGIKPLFKNVKNEKIKIKNILIALIVVSFLVIMSLINTKGNISTLNHTPLTIIVLLLSGFLDAIGTIVPGICGTALLMIVGYYNSVIGALSDIFNISNLGNNLFILIPFLIGMILGIMIISKILNYLFKNHKNKTYYSIIGLSITSTIILFIQLFGRTYQMIEIIIGIILFILGYIIVYALDKNGNE